MEKDKSKLQQIISNSSSIVFFGGAGVSTESGIPDFRSADGLYSQQFAYPPETMLSRFFFVTHTEDFFRFYREKILCYNAQPGIAHKKLAEMERTGRLKAVVTQNIDGLHQQAGSINVLELHGSIHRNYCQKCSKQYDLAFIKSSGGIPRCECGGIIKPDVVLYEEPLDADVCAAAVRHISNAQVLIVGGTSLSVYPAAGMLNYFSGSHLVLINKSATPYDNKATLVFRDSIGAVLGDIHVA